MSASLRPSLMVTCDDNGPGIMDMAEAAMRAVFPHYRTCRVRKEGAHDVTVYSNGCRVTNWAERTVAGARNPDAPDQAGVEWRVTRRGDRPYNVSVARRASVALTDRFVGPKS